MTHHTNVVLHVENLRYAYPAAREWTLDGVDFEVQRGEWIAITGANGSGKTTLCRALAGLTPHLTGGRFQGRVVIAGRDSRTHPPASLLGVVGMTFQDAESQLFAPDVESEIVWGLEALGIARAVMAERLAWALAAVGLEHVRHRPPDQLSGGQQRRLALAAMLAMQPEILVLDTPLAGLDPLGRAEVLATLQTLRQQQNLTVLIAEPDLSFVAHVANRVVVLENGRVANSPPIATNHAPTDAFSAPVSSEQRETALEFHDISFSYTRERVVLDAVSLRIPRGEFVALVGANGSGKTTLAKHAIGLLRPESGTVRVHGQETAGLSIGELAKNVGFLFQNAERQIFSPTVFDEVAFALRNAGLAEADVDQCVQAALARFQLTELEKMPPALLSFAQQRRVTLASVEAMQTPILVLDEPTVGLDAAGRAVVLDWLREACQQGRTVVLVTHDLALVRACATRVVVMSRGGVVADGAPAAVLAQHALLAQVGLVPPTSFAEVTRAF